MDAEASITPIDLAAAEQLQLDISKTKYELDWLPKWGIDIATRKAMEWYKLFNAQGDVKTLTSRQIDEYSVYD